MAQAATTAVPGTIVEALRKKLQESPAPLKVADAVKGLPKPKKAKAAELLDEVRKLLDEEVQLGRAFRHPSAKDGEARYWFRDEEGLIREKALEVATTPRSFPALLTAVGKEVKGADKGFIEGRLRKLIRDDLLFEHPQPGKKGGPLFGASPPPPPPPPLEQAQHKKAVEKLVADCRKLLAAASVPVEELVTALRRRLQDAPSPPAEKPLTETFPGRNGDVPIPPPPPLLAVPALAPVSPGDQDLENLILRAAGSALVRSIPEVRREVPEDLRGPAFDAAVLRLADQRKVIITQDCDETQLTPDERDGCVRDGRTLFNTISRVST